MAAALSWKAIVFFTATLCTFLAGAKTLQGNNGDKITNLPGQPKVSFQQYSGYVAVDQKKERALFYYFAEAETQPDTKPLVLWLNGGLRAKSSNVWLWDCWAKVLLSKCSVGCYAGPGCSSVGVGAFCEHGPFKPSRSVLKRNEYSWNKEANMLYLESPAGVGFSYSANKSYYAYVNDEMTARDNLAFLENWFKKFTQYKNREFFITGESYAGHYVPQLAHLIVQSKAKINLKGIAIGNPLLEFNTDFNARGEYFWSHGLISDSTFELFNTVCNYSQIRRQGQIGKFTAPCALVNNRANAEISRFVDAYDVTLDVCLSSLFQQAEILNQWQETEKIDVCVEDETIEYLNRKDVQIALHAQLLGVNRWGSCSDVLQYDMQNLEVPTIPILGSLVKSGIRVLVFSGDQDSVIPLTGTRFLVNKLAQDLGLSTTVPYGTWFEGKQVAGWTQGYGELLSFATIRGAAHEAPFTQPERSLVMFSSFLAGKPLPRLDGKIAGKRNSPARIFASLGYH